MLNINYIVGSWIENFIQMESINWLSFHKVIIDKQQFLFYIILLNTPWYVSFYFYYYVRA